MMRMTARVTMTGGWVCLAALCGCEPPGPPQDLYPVNLATREGQYLLPQSSVVHLAHDASILSGQTKATVVKRGDAVPPPPANTRSGNAPTSGGGAAQADSLTGAFANVAKAFVSGLVGGQAAGGGPQAAGPQAGSAGGLSPADRSAIGAIAKRFSDAVSRHDVGSLAGLYSSAQQPLARQHYAVLADTIDALDALGDSVETKQSGTKAQVNAVIDAYLRKQLDVDVAQLSVDGPDQVTAGSLRFVRAGTQWAVEYAGDYQAFVDQLRAAAQSVQDGADALSGRVLDGSMAPDAAVAGARQLIGG